MAVHMLMEYLVRFTNLFVRGMPTCAADRVKAACDEYTDDLIYCAPEHYTHLIIKIKERMAVCALGDHTEKDAPSWWHEAMQNVYVKDSYDDWLNLKTNVVDAAAPNEMPTYKDALLRAP